MQENPPQESKQSFKSWIPSIVLICIMFLLLAATRVYIGGPDGIEVVWKGELNLSDTFVNVSDYIGLPRKEFKNRALLDQMEDMGLLDTDADEARLRRHLRKKKLKQKEAQERENRAESQQDGGTENSTAGANETEKE